MMPDQKKKNSKPARWVSDVISLLLFNGLMVIYTYSLAHNFDKWIVGLWLTIILASMIYHLVTAKTRRGRVGISGYLLLLAMALIAVGYLWPLRGIPLLLGMLIWTVCIAITLMPDIKDGLKHLAKSYREISRKDRNNIRS